MAVDSVEHRIRVALGKAFHHKHQHPEGAVDLGNIAAEQGVSEDQVKEQMTYLRDQNILAGPEAVESEQISGVPAELFGDEHSLSDDGLAWASAGYPVL
jgi:hypothetical protein